VSTTIDVPVADGTSLPIYEAPPDGEPRGAVVVVQEAFGVNDHIEDVTRRFAAAGFHAVAPHLFHRSGDPRLAYEPMAAAMPHLQALTAAGLGGDIDATLEHLHAAGFADRGIGFVGFCMGGTVALIVAATRPIGAAVSFYGSGILEGRFGAPPLVELAPQLQAPWLGLYGDEDHGIPIEQVEALGRAASTAAVPTELIRYPEAGHGFHCDARASYHEASALDAWERCVAWLGAHLAPPAPLA
jgi:carboxymethylenebutenolidase